MKPRTNIEINELAKLNAWSDFRDFDSNCSLSSYEYEIYLKAFNTAFQMCQQDLLSQASEGFKEWIYKYVAEEAWQACSLSHAKKIQEKDAEIERLRRELRSSSESFNTLSATDAQLIEELKKENEELKQELLLSKPLYSQRKLEERIKEAEEIIVSWNKYLKRENELASKIGTVADDYIAKWNLPENTDSSKGEVK